MPCWESVSYMFLIINSIKVNEKGYKLNTGILVQLDNWDSEKQSAKNYMKISASELVKGDLINESVVKISQLVNNIPVIGAIVSAFEASTLSLIFNPGSQTVDVILFDNER